jgi:hypothetical protein
MDNAIGWAEVHRFPFSACQVSAIGPSLMPDELNSRTGCALISFTASAPIARICAPLLVSSKRMHCVRLSIHVRGPARDGRAMPKRLISDPGRTRCCFDWIN